MTKDMILQEALKLFSNSGYEGTSIRQIASKVGIKESSIYSHFSSKEEIFRAIIKEYDTSNEIEKMDFERLAQEPDSYLCVVLENVLSAYENEDYLAYERLIFLEGIKNGTVKELVLNETCNKIEVLFGSLIDFLVKIEYLRGDIPKDMLLVQFLSPFFYIHFLLISHQYTQEEKSEKIDMMRKSLEHFLKTYKK